MVNSWAGAGGDIGMGLAALANPDGYTILAVSSSYVVNPSLYSEVQRIHAQPDVCDRACQGFDVIASTPDRFAAQIKAEAEKWRRVIRNASIKVD